MYHMLRFLDLPDVTNHLGVLMNTPGKSHDSRWKDILEIECRSLMHSGSCLSD